MLCWQWLWLSSYSQALLTPDIHSSNPVIGKFFLLSIVLKTILKRRKRGQEWPFKNVLLWFVFLFSKQIFSGVAMNFRASTAAKPLNLWKEPTWPQSRPTPPRAKTDYSNRLADSASTGFSITPVHPRHLTSTTWRWPSWTAMPTPTFTSAVNTPTTALATHSSICAMLSESTMPKMMIWRDLKPRMTTTTTWASMVFLSINDGASVQYDQWSIF